MSARPLRSAFLSPRLYRLAVASEWLAPLLRLAGRARRLPAPRPPSEWRRAVLLGAHHIGDVLYNTPSLPALHRGLPECEWWHVARGGAAEVLRGNPSLAGTITPEEFQTNARKWDAVVCYNSASNLRDLALAWRLGIPSRAGYVHKGFSALVTHPIEIRFPQPYPAYFRDLVTQFTGLAPDWPLLPQVSVAPPDEASAQRHWSALRLGESTHPVLACFVTSRQPSGVWPAESFARAVALARTRSGFEVVLMGAAEDRLVLERLEREFLPGARVSAGDLSLTALAAFLRRCAAVLCPDSGPRHLANAAGCRVLYVPNLAVGKVQTGTYLPTETDLAPEWEKVPPADQAAVFAKIPLERVAIAVVEALRSTRGDRDQLPGD